MSHRPSFIPDAPIVIPQRVRAPKPVREDTTDEARVFEQLGLNDGQYRAAVDDAFFENRVRDVIAGMDLTARPAEPQDEELEARELSVPVVDPRDEALAAALARIKELEARPPEVRIERVEVPVAAEWPDLNDKLSDWDEVGHGAIASNIPAGIAELMEPGETLTRDVRRKLTERLNVELAELKNLRGLAGEDLKREAEIEKLLGLFARLGEI